MLLSLVWLVQKHFLNLKNILNLNFAVMALFYLLYIVGLLYSEDKRNGMFQVEQKLSLAVFPLIFATIPQLGAKNLKLILFAFVTVCLFASLYCLALGAVENYASNHFNHLEIGYFTNQQLAGYIGTHSTYFSMYIAFSFFIVLDNLLKDGLKKTMKPLFIFILAYLTIFLVLLVSRIVLIAVVLITIVRLFGLPGSKKKNYKLAFVVGVIAVLLAFVGSGSDYFRKRFSELYHINVETPIGNNGENGVTQRLFFWRNSIDVISESPLVGHGTGDANLALKKEYAKILRQHPEFPESVVNAVHFFEKQQYNAHNQFLQVMILFGLMGLIIFLWLLTRSFMVSIKNKNFIYFSFLSIIVLSCLTECIFDRQFGVVFFSFFNAIFLFHGKDEKNNHITTDGLKR